ncbi:uncharacterized protein KD926_004826 [Aspergillus affinis]|uniref:uncharacterized protein n=1 Tax=Aspergillus affinis TaxID=1070780 RepID=UPI0022FE9036|nr:uncharacterized protein KD926_004826 [Aspergillus affinis]KAI9035012.1 hypothetical protein KD926_004826 [Aspergillus affinis]
MMTFLADLPAKCTTIAHLIQKNSKELSDAKSALSSATSELSAVKEIRDVLFALVEKLWLLLCTYEHQQGASHRERQTMEFALDLALARFDLLTLRIDRDNLRQENAQLQEALRIRMAEETLPLPVASRATEGRSETSDDHSTSTTEPT